MSTTNRVGGDIDASCTRCKMLLGHTILAMVGGTVARVRCNTCKSEHVFRRAAGAAKPVTHAKVRSLPPRSVTDLDALLTGKDISRARRYKPSELLIKDDVISHASFGLGLVMEVRGDKAEVAFRAGPRTLVHGRRHDFVR